MVAAIVCADKNFGIGYKGQLLANIPEDMKYFKELTTPSLVIMGRKTYESIPNRPLKDRFNLVIKHFDNKYGHKEINDMLWECDMSFTKITIKVLKFLNFFSKKKVNIFVIGGSQIYNQLLPMCDTVYLTRINKSFENVDTYFPNLNNSSEWEMIARRKSNEVNPDFTYEFLTYKRKKKKNKNFNS